MAVNYNKVIIAGNLTRDPQTRYLQNNRAVANFSLAVNRRWRDGQGQPQEETTFVEVEAWGTQAENVGKYMSKGRSCLVEGRLKLDSWNDKETGAKRSQLRVVADLVQFLPSSQQGGQPQQANGQSATPPQPPAGGANYDDDEPPF
ncbi:MAG: single-stranded DNA-binding protein [Epibacterium sp.]|nr:single-stranded DNA-binding protein [Epibacterium sp.]NQX74129.1 single-stranded DNA-binding protein [Epibacterium sp.]